MKRPHFFVTGTDTGVGKTRAAASLVRALSDSGLRAAGMKPAASGAETGPDGLYWEDVEALVAASNVDAPREWVNPYCFKEPVSPHIAADNAGVAVEPGVLVDAYRQLSGLADAVVVEGAGGFLAPLTMDYTFADLACALRLPVLLVVGMRLGCINHAMLSVREIQARGLELAGWIANDIDPNMLAYDANLDYLKRKIPAPLVARLPFEPASAPHAASARFDRDFLDGCR